MEITAYHKHLYIMAKGEKSIMSALLQKHASQGNHMQALSTLELLGDTTFTLESIDRVIQAIIDEIEKDLPESYIVTDHGDGTVGIPDTFYSCQCPWTKRHPPAPELREEFRHNIFQIYNDYCNGAPSVTFETDKDEEDGR